MPMPEPMPISKSTLVFLLFFLLCPCVKIGSGTSFIGVCGGTDIDIAANFARAWEDFLPLVLPLAVGWYCGEGAGGCTNFAVCRLDQEVAIVIAEQEVGASCGLYRWVNVSTDGVTGRVLDLLYSTRILATTRKNRLRARQGVYLT